MLLRSYMLAGSGEKMQYLAHEFNDSTIRFVLLYPERVQPEVLERAVRTVVARADVLHASFIAGHATALWHINGELETADYFACVETENPAHAAVQAALMGIAPESKAQQKCRRWRKGITARRNCSFCRRRIFAAWCAPLAASGFSLAPTVPGAGKSRAYRIFGACR